MTGRLRALWRRWTYPPGVHARPRHDDQFAVPVPPLRLPAETPPAPRSTWQYAADDTTTLPATAGGTQ